VGNFPRGCGKERGFDFRDYITLLCGYSREVHRRYIPKRVEYIALSGPDKAIAVRYREDISIIILRHGFRLPSSSQSYAALEDPAVTRGDYPII
jgi:hypothetical protein